MPTKSGAATSSQRGLLSSQLGTRSGRLDQMDSDVGHVRRDEETRVIATGLVSSKGQRHSPHSQSGSLTLLRLPSPPPQAATDQGPNTIEQTPHRLGTP
ncbi:hypothetical protein CMUS01_06331 [Colletotrichum musicola]|uniref:Uncharacterized protein n=1 Tax=Colletotrichum musicola TaxID=2175873 RepID=A0A8H6KMV6_9PEZI|nr:hypothetical protein CMUS01_06331 [Colletotrichum musicola]